MAAGRYDFTVEQGTTHITTFVWKTQPGSCCNDPDAVLPAPAPRDLTGYTLRMQIRPSAGSATLYYDANEINQRLVKVTPLDGIFALYIPPADSTAWTWKRGVYDIELTHTASGLVTRLLEGWVTVSPEVTQDP
jgi:hypothetical protein